MVKYIYIFDHEKYGISSAKRKKWPREKNDGMYDTFEIAKHYHIITIQCLLELLNCILIKRTVTSC